MKTAVSYVYYETKQSIYNLDFFVQIGIYESDDTLFIIVINGEKCIVELPTYKNCIILRRPNTGYDFGGHNAAIQYLLSLYNTQDVNMLPFENYIFMNSGVIGPFLPPCYHHSLSWTYAFTNKLNDKVKLVGTSIVCFWPGRAEGQGPHVEGFCFCLDKIGLAIAVDKGTIFTDHKDKTAAITNGEYGLSKAIIAKGYTVDCLLYKYQNVDWFDKKNWYLVSNGKFVSRSGTYDGISIHPFEVVFHKWYWSHYATKPVSFDFVDKYKKWKLDELARSKSVYATYGLPDYNINVTQQVMKLFSQDNQDNQIIIPENCILSTIFPDIYKVINDPNCCLYLTLNKNLYVFKNENKTKFELNIHEPTLDGSVTAFYGTFDSKVDVTTKFMSYYQKGAKIIIAKTSLFNDCFGDVCPNKVKRLYLHLNNLNLKYAINEKRYRDLEFNTQIDKSTITHNDIINNTHKINIVYTAYIYSSTNGNWRNILAGQLIQLKKTGLLEIATLYVHIVSGSKEDIDLARNMTISITRKAMITSSTQNEYEYRGLHLLWSLAQKEPDSIYLYFHTKGMLQNPFERTFDEKQIFQEVIEPWKKILQIFDGNSNINKIGYGASEQGFIWFNFWWARGTYLKQCVEPTFVKDEFYYETWLQNKEKTYEDCYSLADNTNNKFYTPNEICKAIDSVSLLFL